MLSLRVAYQRYISWLLSVGYLNRSKLASTRLCTAMSNSTNSHGTEACVSLPLAQVTSHQKWLEDVVAHCENKVCIVEWTWSEQGSARHLCACISNLPFNTVEMGTCRDLTSKPLRCPSWADLLGPWCTCRSPSTSPSLQTPHGRSLSSTACSTLATWIWRGFL